MKTLVPLILSCTALSVHAAPAPSCAVPIERLSIEGLTLNEPAAAFQKRFAQAKKYPETAQSGMFEAEPAQLGMAADVGWVMHISYQRNSISSFAINYNDFDTPITKLAPKWIARYNLPKTGWKKGRQQHVYRCRDYELTLKQDFGVGRGTTGAVIMLYRR